MFQTVQLFEKLSHMHCCIRLSLLHSKRVFFLLTSITDFKTTDITPSHRNEWRTFLLNKKSRRGTDSCWLKMIEKCLTDSFEIRQRNDNNHKNRHGRQRDNQTDMLETDRQTRRPWFSWKLRDRKSCVLSVCLTSVPFLLTFGER